MVAFGFFAATSFASSVEATPVNLTLSGELSEVDAYTNRVGVDDLSRAPSLDGTCARYTDERFFIGDPYTIEAHFNEDLSGATVNINGLDVLLYRSRSHQNEYHFRSSQLPGFLDRWDIEAIYLDFFDRDETSHYRLTVEYEFRILGIDKCLVFNEDTV